MTMGKSLMISLLCCAALAACAERAWGQGEMTMTAEEKEVYASYEAITAAMIPRPKDRLQ